MTDQPPGSVPPPPGGGFPPPPPGGGFPPPPGGDVPPGPPPGGGFPPAGGFPPGGAAPVPPPPGGGGYPPPPPGGGYPPPPPGGPAQAGNLADWPTRAIGFLIDLIPWFILIVVGQIVALALGSFFSYPFSLLGIAYFLYLGHLNGVTGQTPGKKVQGIRVVSEQTGQPIGSGQGIVRALVHFVDSCICYIGWLFPLWDAKKQTLADKIIKTVVITGQPKEPFSVDIFKP